MSPRRATRLAVGAAVVGLLVASCGGGSDSAAPAPTDALPPATEAAPVDTDSDTSTSTETDTGDTAAPAPEAPTSDAAAPEPPATEAPAPAPVPEILQFTAPLVGGGELDASTLSGTLDGKATAFWFWAPT